jgi:hypothetical protein
MIKRTWINHGTKVLGWAGIVVSSALAANAILKPEQALIPPSYIKWFVFANILFGALTVKRGYTNSKTAPNEPPPQ